MISLRPYQHEALEAMWSSLFGEDHTLCVAPTGSGKTRILAALVERARGTKPGIRIAVLMGRIDLVSQTERAFREFFPARDIGVLCGSLSRRETDRPVTLVSIQSVKPKEAHRYDLVIVDEVHRMDQDEGAYVRYLEACRGLNFKVKVVGVTATPWRATGLIYGKDQLFSRVCYRKSLPEMIGLGFLCRPILRAADKTLEHDVAGLRLRMGEYMQEDVDRLVSDQDRCLSQVRDALSQLADRRCAVWACASIAHCNMVADALMSLGERVTTVHSKLKSGPRADNLAAFVGGACRHMSFVSVLSEGFDHPPIDAVVLMRPMRSPVLYVQTVGRGLRPAEGKKDCLVLDYGQVVRTIGPLDDPSIAKGGGMRERDGQLKLVPEIPQLECQACRAFTRAPAKACGECGAEFPPPPAPSQKIDLRAGGGDILSSDKAPPAPVTQTLGPVVVSPHTAKSGNQCVKIHYQDGAVMSRHGWGGGVYEFFVCSNPWAMDRLEQRLERIGIDLPDTDGSHVFPGTFEVTTLREGKYDRVKDVRRTSPANPGSAVGFGDDEEEENADFPFGYNNQTPRGIGF